MAWRLPYRWVDGNKRRRVDKATAEATAPVRTVGGMVVLFSFSDESVVDCRARELAVLLEDCARWLRANPYVTVLGMWWDTSERTELYLSVED